MSTHDTAESLMRELNNSRINHDSSQMPLKYGKPFADSRLICDRALARLALLERGIEKADSRGTVHYHEDTYPSLRALIEELGREPNE